MSSASTSFRSGAIWTPLPNFIDSLKTFSNSTLYAQRIHIVNLMDVIHEVQESELPKHLRVTYITPDSPVYLMWVGYEMQLCEYGLQACEEFERRNLVDEFNLYEMTSHHLDWATGEEADMGKPNWFGDVDVHLSHQAALIRFDPDHYRKYFKVDESLPVVWPRSRYARSE